MLVRDHIVARRLLWLRHLGAALLAVGFGCIEASLFFRHKRGDHSEPMRRVIEGEDLKMSLLGLHDMKVF